MNQPPDNVVFDLDTAFAGVDERNDGAAMPGSSDVVNGARVAAAVNVRFTGRAIETRGGYVWSVRYNPEGRQGDNTLSPGNSGTKGAGAYVNPNDGREYVLLCRDYGNTLPATPERIVWLCRDDSGPTPIAAGAAEEFPGTSAEAQLVRFSQLGGDVLMWRRGGRAPLLWDGDGSGSFAEIATVEPNDATPAFYEPLPAAEFAAVAADRLVFPYEGGVGYTDILEARRWDPATTVLAVGDDGGAVTGLLWWRGRTLLVFKRSSVWAVENWYGDLSQISVNPNPITRQCGCIAPDTITETAEDVIWLGQGGVYSLSKAIEAAEKNLNATPVSWLIPRTMGRINWSTAHLSCAVLSREIWVLAVPLEGATLPDTLLVWNAVTAEWHGTDVPGGGYGAGHYLALQRCRLFGRDTYTAFRKNEALTAGWSWKDRGDDSSDGDVAWSVRFRAYHAPEHGKVRWVRMEVETEELGTEGVTLTACGDGRGTVIPLQGATTRDRTAWKAWGQVPRAMDNSDDDFNEPGRDDYAFVIETDGVELRSGIIPGLLQAHTLKGNVTGMARALAPVVAGTAGRVRVNVIRAAGVR